jgi:SsrA-binding protein
MMSIIDNKKAHHDYFIEDKYEAGLVLEGWEVKAIRAGRSNIKEAHVTIKDGELFLFNSHISPLLNTSGFTLLQPTRSRKLLLNRKEIDKLLGKVTKSGYTIVPLNFHFNKGRIKCEIGLAKGKKQHDKRAVQKDRDGKREVEKAMKQNAR